MNNVMANLKDIKFLSRSIEMGKITIINLLLLIICSTLMISSIIN